MHPFGHRGVGVLQQAVLRQVGAVLAVQRQQHIFSAQGVAAQVLGQAVGVPGGLGIVGREAAGVAPGAVDCANGADALRVLVLAVFLLIQLRLQLGRHAALGHQGAGLVGKD